MIIMAVSNKYENLSELQREFRSGHIIVEETLFEVDKGNVVDSWDLSGGSPEKMAAEARQVADLSNHKRIVYDDEGIYDANIVADEGDLVTAQEAYDRMEPEEQDDHDSFLEHCLGM
jgi:hypothetical protein